MTVIYAFDTLGYAKRLREGGVPNPQAEAHAEAAREFIMIELVTKQDLQAAIDTQTLRLTVRLGGIVAAGFGVMGAAMGMFALFLRLH
jgi:acyl dehydratase